MATMLAARRLPSLARVAARPQIAALGTTSTCKERQLAWQLYARRVDLTSPEFKTRVPETPSLPYSIERFPTRPVHSECRQKLDATVRVSPRTPSPRRPDPRRGAHPFSSFEKTLQGREAVEENLYIRDKEAAAKYKREAELQAERLADASKAFKKEFSQELATMLHQKHLAERQKALRK